MLPTTSDEVLFCSFFKIEGNNHGPTTIFFLLPERTLRQLLTVTVVTSKGRTKPVVIDRILQSQIPEGETFKSGVGMT